MNDQFASLTELAIRLALGSTLCVCVGLLTMFMLRKQSSAAQHFVGSLTLVGLALIYVACGLLPSWKMGLISEGPQPITPTITTPTELAASNQVLTNANFKESLEEHLAEGASQLEFEEAAANRVVGEASTVNPNAPQILPVMWFWLFQLLVCAYCVGVVLGVLRTAAHHVMAMKLVKSSREVVDVEELSRVVQECLRDFNAQRRVKVLLSDQVIVPMVTGLLHCRILLPHAALLWPPAQIRSVLAHEWAHIERRDLWGQLLADLITSLYWPQPLVWLLSARLRKIREFACDDRALIACCQPTQYARHLLEVAADLNVPRCKQPRSLLAMARRHNVETRVAAILQSDRRRKPLASPARLGWIAVLMSTSLLIAFTNPFAEFSVSQEPVQGPAQEPLVATSAVEAALTAPAATEANRLAWSVHARAGAIDQLQRFSLVARHASFSANRNAGVASAGYGGEGGIRLEGDQPNAEAVFRRALRNMPDVAADGWFRFRGAFAWDEQTMACGIATEGELSNQTLQQVLNQGSTWWGTKDGQAGSRAGQLDGTAKHYLQQDISHVWPHAHHCINFILATRHQFWWGDNSHHNLHLTGSSVPPELADYELLSPQVFDLEVCDVLFSKARLERLWVNRETGYLRGYLCYHPATNRGKEFLQSELVREICGQRFESPDDWNQWAKANYSNLTSRQKLAIEKTSNELSSTQELRPAVLVRFGDYRPIAQGIDWPFQEDRLQFLGKEPFYSIARITEIRTDLDLTPVYQQLQPKAGELVQDQRVDPVVEYVQGTEGSSVGYRKQVTEKSKQKGSSPAGNTRQLPEPIEIPNVPAWLKEHSFSVTQFHFARVKYNSAVERVNARARPSGGLWATDYPDADLALAAQVESLTKLKVAMPGAVVELTDPKLNQQHFLYMGEAGRLHLNDNEVTALRKYLDAGGFLMLDDTWGEAALVNIRAELKKVFPNEDLVELPLEHSLFHNVFDFQEFPQSVSIHAFANRQLPTTPAQYLAIMDDDRNSGGQSKRLGRIRVLVCHDTDLGDGWERARESQEFSQKISVCRAFPMAINAIYYALSSLK